MNITTLNKVFWSVFFLFSAITMYAQPRSASPSIELDIKEIRSCSDEKCLEPIDLNDSFSGNADTEIIFNMIPSDLEMSDVESITFTATYHGLEEFTEIWFLEIRQVSAENIMVTHEGFNRYTVTIFYEDLLPGELREGTSPAGLPITTRRTASTKTNPGKGQSSTSEGCYRIEIEEAYAFINGQQVGLMGKSAIYGKCTTSTDPVMKPDLTIKTYPNPTNNILNIEYSQDKQTEILISDINGRIYRRANRTSNNGKIIQVDVENIPNGIYLLNIITSKNTIRQRFVVAR